MLVTLRVRAAEYHAVTGLVLVGPHRAAGRIESPVEEQSFYSLVIVEVLHVPQVRDRGPHMRVQAPASMSRAESASDQLYSPAATSGRTCARTTARPARSCDETGSSNQVTPIALSSSATRTAWPVV